MLNGLKDLLEIVGCSFVVLYLADGFVVSWSYLFFVFFAVEGQSLKLLRK